MTENQGSIPSRGRLFLFSTAYRSALGVQRAVLLIPQSLCRERTSSNAEVRNVWDCISTKLHALMEWCLKLKPSDFVIWSVLSTVNIALGISGIFGFCPPFGILKNTFLKLDLFSSSGEEGEMPTVMGPLERSVLSYWAQYSRRLPPPHLRRETDTIVETLCSWEHWTLHEVQNPNLLYIPKALTYWTSAFCPHDVFCLSYGILTINRDFPLNTINRLSVVVEMLCSFWEIRAEFLYAIPKTWISMLYMQAFPILTSTFWPTVALQKLVVISLSLRPLLCS
jgi:hypothetical protein